MERPQAGKWHRVATAQGEPGLQKTPENLKTTERAMSRVPCGAGALLCVSRKRHSELERIHLP